MTESMYEFVLAQLEERKGTWADVAEATGIPLRSIEKIARQEWKNPGVNHIDSLAAHFGFFQKVVRARRALSA